ncbi:MAG: hypothetical protein Dbin4_00625 [Alphaproteobacteria bacterium]|nr:hypothetical protein [Alphaproteobacteria bacterium]
MKYSTLILMAAALVLPAAAQAHPGDHADISGMIAALWHLVSQPDHALMLTGAAAAGIYLLRKNRRNAGGNSF